MRSKAGLRDCLHLNAKEFLVRGGFDIQVASTWIHERPAGAAPEDFVRCVEQEVSGASDSSSAQRAALLPPVVHAAAASGAMTSRHL